MEGEGKIKEEIKKVYNPYIPPASMLVFDAMQKGKPINIT